MEFSSSNQLSYNGKRYYLFVTFTAANEKPITLELRNISLVKFENQLNQLVSTAEVTFLDQHGAIDKFILHQDVACKIQFYEVKDKSDQTGLNSVELLNYDEYFDLMFIVNNFQILNRSNGDITYKAYLIQTNIINLLGNVNFTNYGDNKASKNILDILINCYSQVNLKFSKKTKDYNKCNIDVDYITHDNDNIFTVTHYLLDKMFYYRDYESSIKFIGFNQYLNEYEIIDLNTLDTAPEVTTCVISPFNNSNESLTTEAPIQFATIINSSLVDSYKAQVASNFFEYDKDVNTFKRWTLKNETIRDVLNTLDPSIEVKDQRKRYNLNLSKINSSIERFGNYWNNDYSIYHNLTKTMLEQNTLVVNMPGRLSTHVGSRCIVNIDRQKPSNDQTDIQQKKEEENRYKGFEGLWYIGKLTFLVRPQAMANESDKNVFSQNLTLFRNNIEIIQNIN